MDEEEAMLEWLRKRHDENILDDYLFERENGTMSVREMRETRILLDYCRMQRQELNRLFKEGRKLHPQNKNFWEMDDFDRKDYPFLPEGKDPNHGLSCVISLSSEMVMRKARAIEQIKEGEFILPSEERPKKRSRIELRALFDKIGSPLEPEQRRLYDTYINHLLNPDDEKMNPPPAVLCQGMGGTGKTELGNAVIEAYSAAGIGVIKTSFNAINAIAIHGRTTSSLLKFNAKDSHAHEPLKAHELEEFKRLTKFDRNVGLIVVEEVSNQAPWHLAKLSMACKQAMNNHDKPFGGLPILYIGDLRQLDPVKAGLSLTQKIMQATLYFRGHDGRGN